MTELPNPIATIRHDKPRIALITLGGTIAMVEQGSGGGAVPALGPDAVLAALDGVEDIAEVSTTALSAVSSANLTLDRIADLARATREAIEGGARGVVITQGTDTIEEVAFALDLMLEAGPPVVITGALRLPELPGADGPANLLAAIRVAADPASTGLGVLVVMNDEIHSARHVRKAHTSRADAFSSAPLGPLGYLTEGRVRLALHPGAPGPRLVYRGPPRLVPVLTVGMGSVPAEIEPVLDAPIAGAVVAAVGGGHVPAAMAEMLGAAAARMPLVLASRTGIGEVLRHSYGYAGAEIDLIGRGLIPAGRLCSVKARIALQMLLSAGASRDEIRRVLETL